MVRESSKTVHTIEDELFRLGEAIAPLVRQYREKLEQRNAAAKEFNEHARKQFTESQPGEPILVYDLNDGAYYEAVVVERWRDHVAVTIPGFETVHVVPPEFVPFKSPYESRFIDREAGKDTEVPF